MLEEQIEKLRTILTDEDIQKYSGEGFWNLIQAVVMSDAFAGISAINNVKEIIFHVPTILFWDKMKRYLLGTFHNFEDQVKLAAKFNKDNKKYSQFIKRQIHIIDQIEDDLKVDYFSNLTRCFLLTSLEQDLFFKLVKLISISTPEELEYLKSCPMDIAVQNSARISSLYQNGLFTQSEERNGDTTCVYYVLSDFAKALKQNSLNFDQGPGNTTQYCSFEQLMPLGIPEPMTTEDLNNIFEENEVIIDGGNFK